MNGRILQFIRHSVLRGGEGDLTRSPCLRWEPISMLPAPMISSEYGMTAPVGTKLHGDGESIDTAVFALRESGPVVWCRIEMGLNPDGSLDVEHGIQRILRYA